MLKNSNINVKDEIHKISKYKKKMEQSGGNSQNLGYYKAKMNEHKYKLSKAGYQAQDIERMIQKGGEDLNKLAGEAEKAVDSIPSCENRNALIAQHKEETISAKRVSTETKTQAERKEKELAERIAALEKEKDAAVQQTTAKAGLEAEMIELKRQRDEAAEKAKVAEEKLSTHSERESVLASKEASIAKILNDIKAKADEKTKTCTTGGNPRTLSQIADGIRKF